MDIFTITIFASLLVYFLVGNYAGRGVKKLDDYYVAGRNAPTILIVGTLVASLFSTSMFMGEAGFTYDGQMGPYLLFPSIGLIGYVYGALLFGTFIRRSRAPTVADYLGQRFQSHRVQQVAGITIILGLGCYLLVVTQGAAILLSDLTDLSYTEALIAAWISYTIFTMYSGSKGVILTDTIMFLLFIAASIWFAVNIVDGFGGISQSIADMTRIESKPDIAAWHGTIGAGTEWPTGIHYLVWAITIDHGMGHLFMRWVPWQASRHLDGAANEHVVLRSAIYACSGRYCHFICSLWHWRPCQYCKRRASNRPKQYLSGQRKTWYRKRSVPLLLAGIIAAALSSASTFLSLVGFSLSQRSLQPRRGDNFTLGQTRIDHAGHWRHRPRLPVFSVPPNIFWLMLFIGTVFASSWGPVGTDGVSGVAGKSLRTRAFWGIVGGFPVQCCSRRTGSRRDWSKWPLYPAPGYIIGTVASLLAIMVLVSSARRGVSESPRHEFRGKLHDYA